MGRGGAGHSGQHVFPPQSQEALLSPSLLLHRGKEPSNSFSFQGTHMLYGLDLMGREQFAISSPYVACEKKPQELA